MKCKHGILGACALCMEATKRRKEFETMKKQVEELLKRVAVLEASNRALFDPLVDDE